MSCRTIAGVLDRADANKDGFIDKDELTKAVQQQTRHGQGAGPARDAVDFRFEEKAAGLANAGQDGEGGARP